ncbi:MAG: outer membrane protein assembly factor BamE [Pseudomonadota bacterium]
MACSPLARDFGYTPDDRVLRELTVGVDDELTVEELVGRPSSTGVVRASTWYYASSRRETRYFLPPKTTEREIVALSFDDSGVLRNIERFGLQDGRVITLSRRVTDDNTQGITFLQQLFGNLGNFGADSFLDDGGGLP